MNYFELQALSSMTSYKPSFKEAVLRVMEQIEDVSTVCSEETETSYDETNDDDETEYDSDDNPDIRVIPELVTENLYMVFDPLDTGVVGFNELLMAFSMSMKGTARDKLKWAFKLYDRDQSGSITKDEMEDIFRKLCMIAMGPGPEQIEKKRKQQKKAQRQLLLRERAGLYKPEKPKEEKVESFSPFDMAKKIDENGKPGEQKAGLRPPPAWMPPPVNKPKKEAKRKKGVVASTILEVEPIKVVSPTPTLSLLKEVTKPSNNQLPFSNTPISPKKLKPIIGGDKLTTKAADKKSSKKLSFGNIAMAAKKSSLAEAAKANDKTNSAAVNTLSTFTAAAAVADVEKKKSGLDLGSIVKAKMVVTPKLAGKKDEPGNSLKVRKHASIIEKLKAQANAGKMDDQRKFMSTLNIADIIKDPERDCKVFDCKKRARELFDTLDKDRSGTVDVDEYIDGCMMDVEFVYLLETWDGSAILDVQ